MLPFMRRMGSHSNNASQRWSLCVCFFFIVLLMRNKSFSVCLLHSSLHKLRYYPCATDPLIANKTVGYLHHSSLSCKRRNVNGGSRQFFPPQSVFMHCFDALTLGCSRCCCQVKQLTCASLLQHVELENIPFVLSVGMFCSVMYSYFIYWFSTCL